VKRRRRRGLELTERQQLGLVVVLVVLAAASLLYCLGFAGLAVRQVWEKAPWTSPESPEEELMTAPEITSTLQVTATTAPAMTPTLTLTATTTP